MKLGQDFPGPVFFSFKCQTHVLEFAFGRELPLINYQSKIGGNMNKLVVLGLAIVAASVVASIKMIEKELDNYYLDGDWDQ